MKKRKKKKELIDRYKNDSQSPKISMNGKHKGGNVEFLFARQSSSPTHIFIYDFVVVSILVIRPPIYNAFSLAKTINWVAFG